MLPSLNVPVAVNSSCVVGAIVRPTGVTEIDSSVAFVTVSVTLALTVPSAAVIITLPGLNPFASPLSLPIFATCVLDELHEDCAVRLRVLPSLNVPIASNCSLVVSAIVVFPGRIASDARSAAFTSATVVPLIPSQAAIMVVLPRFSPVASPLAVIDATPLFDELHATVPVMSCVLPSEKVPVAVNCCNVPSGIDGFAGVTVIEVNVAFVTVSIALAEMDPELA